MITRGGRDTRRWAMDSNTNVIYIPLLDEGTNVVRPTQGTPLGGGLYRVVATPKTMILILSIGNSPGKHLFDAFLR